MMYQIPQALMCISLAVMMVSDLRYRRIHVGWLGCFALMAGLYAYIRYLPVWVLLNICFNTVLIAIMFSGALILIPLLYHKHLKDCIGLGDVLFLLAITPLFETQPFAIFLIASFSYSLYWFHGYSKTSLLWERRNIPLITTTGLCYLTYSLINLTVYGIY